MLLVSIMQWLLAFPKEYYSACLVYGKEKPRGVRTSRKLKTSSSVESSSEADKEGRREAASSSLAGKAMWHTAAWLTARGLLWKVGRRQLPPLVRCPQKGRGWAHRVLPMKEEEAAHKWALIKGSTATELDVLNVVRQTRGGLNRLQMSFFGQSLHESQVWEWVT